MYTQEHQIKIEESPSGMEAMVNSGMKMLGVRAPHLVDSKLLSDVSVSLGLDEELVEFIQSLESRRTLGRALHTIQEGALIAGIGQLGTGHPESAIPLFGLSLVTNGAVYIEASLRDRMVGTTLKAINAKTQELNVGRDVEQRMSTAIQQATPLLTENERMMYSRPGDLVVFSIAEMLALGISKPEAIPWLAGGAALLVANTGIVNRLYGPRQAAFLKAEQQYLNGEISYKDYHRYVKEVSNVTFIINSITRLFKSMGLVLGSTVGLAGVMLGNVDSASGNIAKNSQGMIGAAHARDNLDKELRELMHTLSAQIKTEDEFLAHKSESESHFTDNSIWLQLLGKGIEKALIFNLSWKVGSVDKNAEGVIDYTDPALGAFYIFGENGVGKSTLIRSILQLDSRHKGFAGLWSTNSETQESQLTDLHSLSLSELRNGARLFSVSGIRAHRHNLLNATSLNESDCRRLLEKFGFNKLVRLIDSDISSLTDKSEGEQIVLGALAFLERAKLDGAKLVVLDEIFGKVDQQNVSKMKSMIDSYVADGLMVVVVAQDPFKMGDDLKNIRGAIVDDSGLTYYDQSVFAALAQVEKSHPDIDIFERVVNPRAWVSALGMSLEVELTDEKIWEYIVDHPKESLEKLNLLFNVSTRWADAMGYGLLTGFRSLDPVEIGYISTGMLRKWEHIFREETQLSTDNDQMMVLNEARSFEYIRDLKLMKEIFGLLHPNLTTEVSVIDYARDVTHAIKTLGANISLTVSQSWFDDELRLFIERERKTHIYPHNLADMILERDLYWEMDCVPAVN